MSNLSYLESLPPDVFEQIIKSGEIGKDDVLRFCSTSKIIKKRCEANNHHLYKVVLKTVYGIDWKDVEHFRYKPRTFLQLFKFDYIQAINKISRGDNFLVPDKVIEAFAKSLNVEVTKLLSLQIFKDIVRYHINCVINGNQIIPTLTEAFEWEKDVSVTSDKIPIIWHSTSTVLEEPVRPIFPPNKHGNYTVTVYGDVKEIRNKVGLKLFDPNGQNRYPTRQEAEKEASAIRLYLAETKKYEEQKGSKLNNYVILGIMIHPDDFNKLKDELNTKTFVLDIEVDKYNPDSCNYNQPHLYTDKDKFNHFRFKVINPQPKQKGYVLGVSDYGELVLDFYTTKKQINNFIDEGHHKYEGPNHRTLASFVRSGKICQSYDEDNPSRFMMYLFEVTLP